MLDINFIREHPEVVRDDLKKRKDSEKLQWVDDLLGKDKEWREAKQGVDELRHRRNRLSQKVNELMKAGKKEDAQEVIKEAKQVLPQIDEQEKIMERLREEVDYYLKRIPNILHDSVPYGKDDSGNEEVRKWGKTRKDEWLKPHVEIAEGLGASFERSAKIAGHGFYFLYGDLALLNQALIRFAIDEMVRKGFTYAEPPLMMRRDPYEGVVDLGDFEDVMYEVEGEGAYLIATSEHPLIGQYQDEVLRRRDLPVTLTGYSMCFRKEVGTHSVDEKGLFRTHQFNKVEMVVLCKPEQSWEWHEKLVEHAEDIFKKLELPYRVVNICTGDIGSIAAKKYDIEAWFPRTKEYKEIVSCSNCTDYQARRLNIKYESESGGQELVHTLNSTAIATSRALVAILENCQNKDGSVTIPQVLRPYMGGKEKIAPQ